MNWNRTCSLGLFLSCPVGLLVVLTAGGCSSSQDRWTFRAVRDVRIAQPFDPGSAGPLKLALVTAPPAEPSKEQSSATPQSSKQEQYIRGLMPDQIARMDVSMQRKVTDRAQATADLRQIEKSLGSEHPRIKEVQGRIDAMSQDIDQYASEWKELKVKEIRASQRLIPPALVRPQTMLMASMEHPGTTYKRSSTNTFVLFIDGDVKPGQYWANADNSVLIRFSAWDSPVRSHITLQGSVRVLAVNKDAVTAEFAVRENGEDDRVLYAAPWSITGQHDLTVTTPSDPAFQAAAVKWVNVPSASTDARAEANLTPSPAPAPR